VKTYANRTPRATAGSHVDPKTEPQQNFVDTEADAVGHLALRPASRVAGVRLRSGGGRPPHGHSTNGHIDFAEINRVALTNFTAVTARILPGGSRRGNEYVVRNPRRNDQSPGSFCINLSSGKWADFACDARGGDPVSLCAYVAGCSQSEAARGLAQMLGVEEKERRRV